MTNSKNELTIVRTAKRSTRMTLLAETMLFLAVMLTQAKILIITSFIFTLGAGIANGLIFPILLLHLLGEASFRKKIIRTAILMLVNIPIAIFYAWLIIVRLEPNL
ncbi:MAG: hypothetical protein EOO96_01200 [Pedobacter sp.]|nr:MAG: hypothetical protein EOO96_01200 [Pedobacter sp.]